MSATQPACTVCIQPDWKPIQHPRMGPIWRQNTRALSRCQGSMAGATDENMRFPLAQSSDLYLDPWKQKPRSPGRGQGEPTGSTKQESAARRLLHLTTPSQKRHLLKGKQCWLSTFC